MRRLRWAAATAIGVGVVVVAAWWIMPPSIVRQLPPGQTLVYISYPPVRALARQQIAPALQRAPSYAAFVRESGFDYERDLDAVALSLDGNPAAPSDATAIVKGRFRPTLTAYLQTHALAHKRLSGMDAYVFPGWARPRQLLTVVRLGGDELLVTNAADPVAVIAHARRWWTAAPPLWRAGNNWRLLAGYLDSDTLQLEAQQQMDGTAEPWRGMERLEARVEANGGGVELDVRTQAESTEAAAEARSWAQTQVQMLRGVLAEEPGRPTLRALLDRLESGAQGRSAWLRLRLDQATLSEWTRPIAQQP